MMRLLETNSLQVKEFPNADLPPYAILSHTWVQDQEVTFDDITCGRDGYTGKKGYQKIIKSCQLAQKEGLKYVWIDTCCIDRANNNELTEAINSMFRWYQGSTICFAYLADLKPGPEGTLSKCRWFTRGWTLQELIASKLINFYSQDWAYYGTKQDLVGILNQVTGINAEVLIDPDIMHTLPVARRMSWAAKRETTRVEDMAYCLLGIFDVNIPLIYGEGRKAFARLQEQIIHEQNDLSIFAWKTTNGSQAYRGILAQEPSEFTEARSLRTVPGEPDAPEFVMTNKGIRISIAFSIHPNGSCIFPLNCYYEESTPPKKPEPVGIYVIMYGPGLYARSRPHEVALNFSAPRGYEQQRYLSKTIAPSILPTVEPYRKDSFVFYGAFISPYYHHEETQPRAWWDHDRKIFRLPNSPTFAAFHLFRCEWASLNERFIVAFGLSERFGPWVTVATQRQQQALFHIALKGDLKALEYRAARSPATSDVTIKGRQRALMDRSTEDALLFSVTLSETSKTVHGKRMRAIYFTCTSLK